MNELRVALKGLNKARVNHVDFAFVVEVGGPIRQNKRKTPADRSKGIAAADFALRARKPRRGKSVGYEGEEEEWFIRLIR
jgi:hypothetical protein